VRFSRPEGAAQAIREINNQVRGQLRGVAWVAEGGGGWRWRLAAPALTFYYCSHPPIQEFEGRKIRVSQAWQQTRY
jgi:hypothetical protein